MTPPQGRALVMLQRPRGARLHGLGRQADTASLGIGPELAAFDPQILVPRVPAKEAPTCL